MIDIKDIICIDCAKFNINDKNIQRLQTIHITLGKKTDIS